jgi:nucleoid-associated protein YgaU
MAGLRPHPAGVRACSAVTRTEPPAAASRPAQARPSLPGAGSPGLRLTGRGRIVLAVLTAVAAGLLGLGTASGGPPDAPPGTAGHSVTRIVVQPGQTLWSIALRADPQADPRLVVGQIMAANALANRSVKPGQRLLVPRG